MRWPHLIVGLAVLGLATVRPVYAEETVSGPIYTVVYFEVAPAAAAQTRRRSPGNTPRRAARRTAISASRCSRRSRGRAGFAVVEVWRDKKACRGAWHGVRPRRRSVKSCSPL